MILDPEEVERDQVGLADRALVEHALDRAAVGHEAIVVHQGERAAGRARLAGEAPAVGRRERQGLLRQHVFARGQRGAHDVGPERLRRRHQHGVDVVARQEIVGLRQAIARAEAAGGGELGEPRRRGIGGRSQRDAGLGDQRRQVVPQADVSTADDPEAEGGAHDWTERMNATHLRTPSAPGASASSFSIESGPS